MHFLHVDPAELLVLQLLSNFDRFSLKSFDLCLLLEVILYSYLSFGGMVLSVVRVVVACLFTTLPRTMSSIYLHAYIHIIILIVSAIQFISVECAPIIGQSFYSCLVCLFDTTNNLLLHIWWI